MPRHPLLVGNESDSHLQVVAERLRALGVEPAVFDADSLPQMGFSLTHGQLVVSDLEITDDSRGWLRRAAPSRWTTGDLVGSVQDVSFRARVRLIATIARHGNREWLTDIDALQAAEDRVHQLAVARRIGISVPRTIVSSDPSEIQGTLGDDAIVKPLSSGAFVDSKGQPQAVHTAPLTCEVLERGDFGAAPFVAQERIDVRRHLRVVTAGSTVRTAALEADRWPLDWRTSDEAHSSWVQYEAPEVEQQAVRLAAESGVGFSSQDWLVPSAGPPTFIDLNPAGQWMFLPEDVANPITEHIVDFLRGQS